ncbi:MAG: alginate O-acetyltransferase AlgF [Alkalispirochaeta sp.]
MNNLAFRGALTLAGAALCALPVFGQDGLYAPSVPDDAALVRVVNLHSRDESPRLDLGRERFAALPAGEVGAYRPVPPGIYILGGAGGVEFTPESGQFYSIVADRDKELRVVTDEVHADPARAQLVLYNFSDSSADLTAVLGETMVLEGVEPYRSEAITVNAITVELSVRVAGDERLRREFDLQRGESYGFFVGSEQVVVAAATVSSE